MTDQEEVILEEDFFEELDAACKGTGFVKPLTRNRAPPSPQFTASSPSKLNALPLNSPERRLSSTPIRKSPTQVSTPQRTPPPSSNFRSLLTGPIHLDLSDDSSEEQDELVLVGVMPVVLPAPLQTGPLLQISTLAPLKRPTQLLLANRQRKLDQKRETRLKELQSSSPASKHASLVRSAGNKSKPTGQTALEAYLGIKSPSRPTPKQPPKIVEPSVEVVNLASASNRFWCRQIEPFSDVKELQTLHETSAQVLHRDHLSRIPWKTLSAQSSYVAALINPPWEQGITVNHMKEHLQPLTTTLLAEGGFLFWWVENEFLDEVFSLCKQWHFHHVENMCWVRLSVDNTMTRRRPTHGAICNQSKLSLFIFKKAGKRQIKLRHQRNADVHFEMDKQWLHHHSRPYEYVYQLIETMLPVQTTEKGDGNVAGNRFLEIWARPHHSRPDWTFITLPDIKKPTTIQDSQDSSMNVSQEAPGKRTEESSFALLEVSQTSDQVIVLDDSQEDTIALKEDELEELLSQRGTSRVDPEQTVKLDNWQSDE